MPRGQHAMGGRRPCVEQQPGLDTRCLGGPLVPGRRVPLLWRQGDEVLAALQLIAGYDHVDVIALAGLPKSASTTLALVDVPCNLGGHRTLLLCPQCHSRRVIVYWDQGDRWGCRECLGLAYGTSQMSKSGRKFAKMYKCANRAGVDLATGVPTKAKGKHWTTQMRDYDDFIAARRGALGTGPSFLKGEDAGF